MEGSLLWEALLNQTHAGILFTARMGSKRLPGKAMAKVFGQKTVFAYLAERFDVLKSLYQLVLCTTELEEDVILVEAAKKAGIDVIRGPAEDKLHRWLMACQRHHLASFATVDLDDVLCDPHIVNYGLQYLAANNIDVVYNDDLPCGTFTYAITTDFLERTCEAKEARNTEMIMPFFEKTPGLRLRKLPVGLPSLLRPDYRLTLDYAEDLDFFRRVLRDFDGRPNIVLSELIEYLDKNPCVREINAFRQRDYKANQAQLISIID